MKFLKNYKLFLEQDETSDDIQGDNETVNDENEKVNKDSLELIKSELQEYRSKISTINDIFSKKDLNDSDLDKELQSSVFNNQKNANERNKYLTMLVSVNKLKRRVDKLSSVIEEDSNKLTNTQRQISDLINRFNDLPDGDQKNKVNSQIKKSEDYQKELKEIINNNKKQFSLSEKNYAKKKEDFEKTMKLEEEKIKSMIQK